jgi:hypothetical protein
MREARKRTRSAVDLYERLDRIPMSELDRLRAKAQLARAEKVAELTASAWIAARQLVRALIVRPVRRALATWRA